MRLLVTGATGFLGSELVPRLVAAGHEVIALVRDPQRYTPPPGIQVVKGDITAFNLGLKTPVEVEAIFHVAAMVSFKESDRAAIYAANCRGTTNVVNFCLNHHIGSVFYCSTVYVCGDCSGQWTESCYNQGQEFRNHYERSKFLAEGYLREAARGFAGIDEPLAVTIFRPSIIVGRASDGQATTFEGFYKPVWAMARAMALVESRLPPREVMEAKLHLPPLRVPLSIHGDPRGTLNLVPVDWVAAKMVTAVGVDQSAAGSRPVGVNQSLTYHLVNPHPLTNAQVCAAMAKALGMRGPHFSLTPPKDPLSKLYNRLIRPFFPYLQGEPTFASSVSDDCPGGVELVETVVRYWRGQQKGDHGATRH